MTCISKYVFAIIALFFSFYFCSAQEPPFHLLSSNETGITFSNNIVEDVSTKENLFDFDYFYNGSGVGVLDINNDGLQDIFFAANQESNKLYLNSGNLNFNDITESAFSDTLDNWSTGVSIVDINNDGYQDIYLCQGGPYTQDRRKNLLYINNADNTFREAAEEYGLADRGISTQAVFFDFDRDGDLDCFVMNESMAYGLDPVSFTRLNLERRNELYISLSHMYINEGGFFVDRTKELNLDNPTFGLGIKVSDFNNDGWKDLYISNDYYLPDMLLINQKGTGFKDEIKEYLNQMSFYGMGMDIADVNNDGMSDIFVLDMAAGDHYRAKTLMKSMNVTNFKLLVEGLQFPHQYMFNSLQLASDNNTYRNIAQFAGVASTDWSWSALIEDFDFDGLKDIHITNGYRRYALDNDFQAKIRDAKVKYKNNVPLEIKKKLYASMPTEKLENVFYKNQDGLKFSNWDVGSSNNPPSYSNGAAIADLDNDGDHDLIVNNMDDEAFIYQNLAADIGVNNFITIKNDPKSAYGIEKVELLAGDTILSYELSTVRGYLSSSEAAAYIGLGKIGSVAKVYVHWSNGEKSIVDNLTVNKIHYLKYNSNSIFKELVQLGDTYFDEILPMSIGIDYVHTENEYDDFEDEILLPFKQSTLGPYVTSSDINNDNLDDLIFSNSSNNEIKIYTQTSTGFIDYRSDVISSLRSQEKGEVSFADLDKNGFMDLLIPASGNEEIDKSEYYRSRLLLGQKDGNFTSVDLPLTSGSTSKLVTIDYDNDGDIDIIECKRHVAQKYPFHASSHVYSNEELIFEDHSKSVFPDLEEYGIINDMLVTDFDNDGWDDIIMVGEWTNIRFYKNEKGKFTDVSNDFNIPVLKGLWFDIEAIDLNNDNVDDYIVGNLGTNSKYKATTDKPLKIYGHDFDSNGTWDLVLSKMYKEDYVPLRGLECSSQQMPFIQDKFETYDLFAKATTDEIYGESLDSAYLRDINILESIALVSNENDGFDVIKLPKLAQISPVLDIEIMDVNHDGLSDIILNGNIYDTEVETPRLDGGRGLILLSDANGNLSSADENITGLDMNGNFKSMTKIYHKGSNSYVLVATENNNPARVYVLKHTKSID